MRAHELPIERLTASECRERFPQFRPDEYDAITWNPTGGMLHASECLAALVERFSASGSGNINDVVSIPAAAKITYKAPGTISNSATGSISDTATVTSPNNVPDPNTANNSATDTDSL